MPTFIPFYWSKFYKICISAIFAETVGENIHNNKSLTYNIFSAIFLYFAGTGITAHQSGPGWSLAGPGVELGRTRGGAWPGPGWSLAGPGMELGRTRDKIPNPGTNRGPISKSTWLCGFLRTYKPKLRNTHMGRARRSLHI